MKKSVTSTTAKKSARFMISSSIELFSFFYNYNINFFAITVPIEALGSIAGEK